MELTLSSNKKFLIIESVTEEEYDQLKLSFTKKVDGYRWHPLYKRGIWNGEVSFVKENKVPSGLWKELIEVMQEHGITVKINDILKLFNIDIEKEDFYAWVKDFFDGYEKFPRDYQIETAFNIIRFRRCLAELATSAGKSLIVFMVIAYLLEHKIADKLMLVVPNVSLVIQATEDFEEYNHKGRLKLNIQQVYAGQQIKEGKNLVIGTYQSLVKKDKEFYKYFTGIIIDECLHPETLIRMGDESEKKIFEIKEGELVLTKNEITGKIEVKEVEYVYKNLSINENVYEIEMEDGRLLKITGNHKVKLVSGEWKRVDELHENDEITDLYINKKIIKITKIEYRGDVYNLRIKSEDGLNHNYFANDMLVSNCHKANSASIRKIMDNAWHCSYRFGVTGTTPKRGTVNRLNLMSNSGPLITNISADYLIGKGFISPCEVKMIVMDYVPDSIRKEFHFLASRSPDDRKKVFTMEQQYIIANDKRLVFICSVIAKSKKNSLVLFHRIEHGQAVYNKLRNTYNGEVYYVDGGTDNDTREMYKHKMEEGTGKILVASYGTFSTGVNITNIHNIFLTESFKSDIIIRQSIGRGLRKHSMKDKLRIVDFIDDMRIKTSTGKVYENYLYKHAKERKRIYTEQNFPYEIKKIKF